jgi:hypothetical protein
VKRAMPVAEIVSTGRFMESSEAVKIKRVPLQTNRLIYAVISLTRACVVSAYENVSRGRNRPAAHKGYPGNAVPIATRPEMELTSNSEQGTRVSLMGIPRGRKGLAVCLGFLTSSEVFA